MIGDRSNDYSNMDPMINQTSTDWASPRDPYSVTENGSRMGQDNLYLNNYDPMAKDDPDQAAYNYQLQQQEQQQLLVQQQQQEQLQQVQYQQQLQQEQYQQYQYKVEPVAYQGKRIAREYECYILIFFLSIELKHLVVVQRTKICHFLH